MTTPEAIGLFAAPIGALAIAALVWWVTGREEAWRPPRHPAE